MQKIEHLGIAVSNLEESEKLYSKLFDTTVYKREAVKEQGVITSFLRCGFNKIELVASADSTEASNVINKYIAKRGEGLHHVAFAVSDLVSEMDRLKKEGFTLMSESPQAGADNKLVCFVHPKTTGGILIELVQERE